jgi:hypothetical protein
MKKLCEGIHVNRRSQWPSGLSVKTHIQRSGELLAAPLRCMCVFTLRRGSAAARLLELRVQIPQGLWMFVCCECCVFVR